MNNIHEGLSWYDELVPHSYLNLVYQDTKLRIEVVDGLHDTTYVVVSKIQTDK